ncbi:hypothetical protein F0919_05065 [Taibaiella lutea]|uniref:Uncharacterized protein n=1 Tax=Taibaiella lutea TaxID=2608001 RepID=A0A5M6CPX4_9BACT|nr:hypothetical protein [Taibaiella lutea]KAA5537046.1 hypothetical protein F0919_05065 [Taibaiella lutea]
MSLSNLTPYFIDGINAQFAKDQVDELYQIFREDFIDNPIILNGKKVKVIMKNSKIAQYSCYCETFTHLITKREGQFRLYTCERAEKIHWIKPIIEAHPCSDILYYKWQDNNGICKEHFWHISKKFMVVLRDIDEDSRIVTAFCVEDDSAVTYYDRFKAYKAGTSTC